MSIIIGALTQHSCSFLAGLWLNVVTTLHEISFQFFLLDFKYQLSVLIICTILSHFSPERGKGKPKLQRVASWGYENALRPSGHELPRTATSFIKGILILGMPCRQFCKHLDFVFLLAEQNQSHCPGGCGGSARSNNWLGHKGQIEQKECFRGVFVDSAHF